MKVRRSSYQLKFKYQALVDLVGMTKTGQRQCWRQFPNLARTPYLPGMKSLIGFENLFVVDREGKHFIYSFDEVHNFLVIWSISEKILL